VTHPNIITLEQMTEVITGNLIDKIVFVGGSTIGLYLDSFGLSQLRVTGDIDVVVGVENKKKYYDFVDQIKNLGFYQSVDEGDPPYRFRYDLKPGILLVDIMSPVEIVLVFSNEWYADGIRTSIPHKLSNGKVIKIFTLPYVLASKIVAFNDRGAKDPYASEDLEDIVALIDGAENLTQEMGDTGEKVKDFIFKNLKKMMQNRELKQAIEGHAPRGSNVLKKFEGLINE